MSVKTDPQSQPNHPTTVDLFSSGQTKILAALILIALGGVFLLMQSGQIESDSPWWVIFLAIPGVMLLYTAFVTIQQAERVTSLALTRLGVGLGLLVLSAIFVFDPTWSFTRNFRLDSVFPFLSDINWDNVWPWFMIVPGIGILFYGIRQRSTGESIVGGVLIVVGLVFIFNISWDLVWPLAIVAVGAALLLSPSRK